jgi:hypothetical protein
MTTWPMELLLFSKEILPILKASKLTEEQARRLEKILDERDSQIKKAERKAV